MRTATGAIDGVTVRPLARIADARGVVCRMLRADDPAFERFGEVYFSGVHEGAVKAWRRHRRTTSNLAVPVGRIRIVLVDDRDGSPTAGVIQVIETGETDYALVTIPPGLWTGWRGLGPGLALVANCATDPHHPDEVDRQEAEALKEPYRWLCP
ncbi:MAG: dTDP-4-dehydrorhamnose 3,5-epimerase family protein [Vicinamibacterales bacterium]|nr:dTDP-4-dehydrorhamnose 3,5-epimerase family protein [Vicinamibacterales bacterium]